jgi:hypothetical protein
MTCVTAGVSVLACTVGGDTCGTILAVGCDGATLGLVALTKLQANIPAKSATPASGKRIHSLIFISPSYYSSHYALL